MCWFGFSHAPPRFKMESETRCPKGPKGDFTSVAALVELHTKITMECGQTQVISKQTTYGWDLFLAFHLCLFPTENATTTPWSLGFYPALAGGPAPRTARQDSRATAVSARGSTFGAVGGSNHQGPPRGVQYGCCHCRKTWGTLWPLPRWIPPSGSLCKRPIVTRRSILPDMGIHCCHIQVSFLNLGIPLVGGWRRPLEAQELSAAEKSKLKEAVEKVEVSHGPIFPGWSVKLGGPDDRKMIGK